MPSLIVAPCPKSVQRPRKKPGMPDHHPAKNICHIRAIHLIYVRTVAMVSFAPTTRPPKFKHLEAWHRRRRAQLEGIVRWLERGDVSGWDEQIEIAEQCVADIAKMARPLPTPKRKGFAPPAYSPVAARYCRQTSRQGHAGRHEGAATSGGDGKR